METMKFKTTIKCMGCVANATPHLNKIVGKDNWEVDIQNPEKILSVVSDGYITPEEVINAVVKAGYKAERID
ncbi:MAG TPA: hypothetical protein VK167_06080 [Flavipsychrobacter sp.]|nr:hypothetical protein [Flavipsychrobacter sp.]